MVIKGQDCIDDSIVWAENLCAIVKETANGASRASLAASGRAAVLDELADKAQKLVADAREPIVIGVAGEYSVGKSLLLSALVGIPGLLTVGPTATTGNVTRIRITQSADGTEPTASKWQVTFCSAEEILSMMGYFHTRLVELSRHEKLTPNEFSALQAAKPAGDWSALARWCRAVSASLTGPIKLLGEEITRLDESGRRYTALLGSSAQLSESAARKGMSQPGLALDADGETLPDDQLPLVRGLGIEVAVPRSVWQLQAVGELVLLDFPGLRSPLFGERDRYLCRREIADVNTILVLMDAGRGPTDTIKEFRDMLREPADDGRDQRTDEVLGNAIMLASARFDELKVEESQVRDAVLRSLDEEDFLSRREVAPLRDLVRQAAATDIGGTAQPLTLVSSMAWLAALEDAHPGTLSPGFRARVNYDTNQGAARGAVRLWRLVADHLDQQRRETDGIVSPLLNALTAFTDEGGLPHLRQRLTEHAAAHGGVQRLDAVRRRGQQVDALRRRAAALLRQVSKEAPVDARYQEISNLVEDTQEFLKALRSDLLIDMDAPDADGGPSLRQLVLAESAFQVSEWPQWRGLYNAVDKAQLVTLQSGSGYADLFGDLLSEEPELSAELSGSSDNSGIPLMSQDFLDPFRAASYILFAFVEKAATAYCLEWISTHLAVARQPGLRWVNFAGTDAPAGPATPAERALATRLGRYTGENYLRQVLNENAAAGRPGTDAVEAAYPLEPGHGLPWHPESPRAEEPRERHVANVARINRELVNALAHVALIHLTEEAKLLTKALRAEAVDGQKFVIAAQDPRFFSRADQADTEARLAELANSMDSRVAPDCLATSFAHLPR